MHALDSWDVLGASRVVEIFLHAAERRLESKRK
jgi:hypothetical protein